MNKFNTNPPYTSRTGQKLALAAMLLGILAIATTFTLTLYLPFILGSLAIILALLSREAATALRVQAIAGIVSGTIGLCINLLIIAIAFSLFGSEIMRESARIYDEMVEEIYGVSSEEILGESMEEKMEKLLDE